MKNHILDILPDELKKYLFSIDEKKYRVKQILNWIYNNNELNFSRMTTLPFEFREKLFDKFSNFLPGIIKKEVSRDGSVKYLLELEDELKIEMVLIPNEKKNTLCVSSQVGCARKCKFCATAKMGLIRNLKVYEIVAQIFIILQELKKNKLTNIVFMGMGEPLDNLQNVIKAIKIIQHNSGFKFSPRRITISTCGIISKIKELTESNLKVKLAVSLNSAIQEKREELMPMSRQYSLSDLKKSLIDFRKKSSFRITFEYVLIKDFNTGKEDIKALKSFLGDISCKLNVIVWNEVDAMPFKAPSEQEVRNFIESMQEISSAVTFRKSRGSDISAACGQLAAE